MNAESKAHDAQPRDRMPGSSPRFPNEADVIFQEAQAFRRLTPTERFLAIVDLMASAETLMQTSPHGAAGKQQRAAEKEEWRRIHREIFARHGS
jgi:hypothetical protein